MKNKNGIENKEFRCILRKRNSCLSTVATTVCATLSQFHPRNVFQHLVLRFIVLSLLLCVGFCKCLSPFVHFISFRNFLLNFRFINDCTFGVKLMVQRVVFEHLYRWTVQNILVLSHTQSGLSTLNTVQTTPHTYALMDLWFWNANERAHCVCDWQSAYWISKLNNENCSLCISIFRQHYMA